MRWSPLFGCFTEDSVLHVSASDYPSKADAFLAAKQLAKSGDKVMVHGDEDWLIYCRDGRCKMKKANIDLDPPSQMDRM